MKTIIVEDEGLMTLFLKETLIELGHEVIATFNNADDLLSSTDAIKQADLILMDILIKGKTDGIQASQEIKSKYPTASIIFITSYKDSDTIQNAQLSSPLAYLIKPINKSDLEATLMVVQSQIKQTVKANDDFKIKISDYEYDKNESLIYENNQLIKLSKKEQICLKELMKSFNQYISQEQLLYSVWNDDVASETSLRELVYRLRKKLPKLMIENNKNYGYILKELS